MMKAVSQWLEIAFGIAGLFVFALLLAAMLPHRVDHDEWDILTALGTIGAAGAAVWLGVRQELIGRRETELRAKLLAARVGPGLERLNGTIASFIARVTFTPVTGALESRDLVRYADSIKSAAVELSLAELAELTPLPRNAAFRLARGLAIVDLVQREMAELGPMVDAANFVTTTVSRINIMRWAHALREAKELLESAQRECEQAAAVVAARPDMAELYWDNDD